MVRLCGKGTPLVQDLSGHHLVCSLREGSKQDSLLSAAQVGALQASDALQVVSSDSSCSRHWGQRAPCSLDMLWRVLAAVVVRRMPLQLCGFLIENQKLKEVGEDTVLTVIGRSLWHRSDLRNLWHFYYLLLCYFYTDVLVLGNFWFLSRKNNIYITHECCPRNEILGYMSLNFSKS